MAFKKRGLIVIIAVIVLVLIVSGCDRRKINPDERIRQDVFRGTEGLYMRFVPDLPPTRIYDAGALNILAELENRGTADVSGTNCYAHLSGYDETIIRGMDREKYCGPNLWGKSSVYPEGGFDTIEFKTDYVRLPFGVDSLKQKFILTTCYDYETIASPIVCIDPNLYKVRALKEACTVRDVTVSGGQGAPVAVTRVDVDMLGRDKVAFRIHIRNVGGGTVLRRGISLAGRGSNSCPYNLDYDDYNIIDYDIRMSGGTLESCSPDQARLIDNEASIFCKFWVSGDNSYTTPLQIGLGYSYMDSISKTVDIIKTPE